MTGAAHAAARRDPYCARLYGRQCPRRSVGKAVLVVARFLAHTVRKVLKEGQPYRGQGGVPCVRS